MKKKLGVDAQKLIDALDVAPCDCDMPEEAGIAYVLAGPPCPHVRAAREHGLTLAQWAALLLHLRPKRYADRPPPPKPSRALTQQARLKVYRVRRRKGYSLYHPLDAWRLDAGQVAVVAEKGKRATEATRLALEGRVEPESRAMSFLEEIGWFRLDDADGDNPGDADTSAGEAGHE